MLKPFYNKKFHLGKSTAEVKSAIDKVTNGIYEHRSQISWSGFPGSGNLKVTFVWYNSDSAAYTTKNELAAALYAAGYTTNVKGVQTFSVSKPYTADGDLTVEYVNSVYASAENTLVISRNVVNLTDVDEYTVTVSTNLSFSGDEVHKIL